MTPRDDIDFSDNYSSDSIESGLEEIITESRSNGRSVTWDDDPRDDEGSDVPAMLAATEARVVSAEAAAEYAEGLAAETAFAVRSRVNGESRTHTHTERERETDRQTRDRQTDRQTHASRQSFLRVLPHLL